MFDKDRFLYNVIEYETSDDIKEILEIKGKQEIITANSIDELIEKFSEKTKGAILFTEYQKKFRDFDIVSALYNKSTDDECNIVQYGSVNNDRLKITLLAFGY